MAKRTVIQEGDPTLRKIAREVTVFDERLGILLDDMLETMVHENGVGLAAPQVGVVRRVVVIGFDDKTYELINPTIVFSEGEETDFEGCLSIHKNKNCMVTRPTHVEVVAKDRFGKEFKLSANGWLARIVCHELDHLDGILFIDKKVEQN